MSCCSACASRRPRGRRSCRSSQGLKLAWSNEPFRRLILAFFLNGIANGLPATLFLLFVRHVLGADVDAGPLLLLYFVSGMLAVPGWLWLSYRIGKHRAWAASMLWACVMFAWVPFLGPGDTLAFAAICVLSGASLGADLAIPASMQADVIDLDRVMSGRRRTAFFFALWSMASKLALAMAVGIAFPVLGAIGFSAEGVQPAARLVGLGPALCLPARPVQARGHGTRLALRARRDPPERAAGTDRSRHGGRIDHHEAALPFDRRRQ